MMLNILPVIMSNFAIIETYIRKVACSQLYFKYCTLSLTRKISDQNVVHRLIIYIIIYMRLQLKEKLSTLENLENAHITLPNLILLVNVI